MEIEEAITAAHGRAVARWPGIAHAVSAIRARVLSIGAGVGDLNANGVDLYLASACLACDERALLVFERLFLHTLPPTIGPVVLTADQLDELQQRLRLRLLVGDDARLGQYGGKGPLGSWVRMCALRMAVDLMRQTRPTLGTDGGRALETLVCQDASPELLAAKA